MKHQKLRVFSCALEGKQTLFHMWHLSFLSNNCGFVDFCSTFVYYARASHKELDKTRQSFEGGKIRTSYIFLLWEANRNINTECIIVRAKLSRNSITLQKIINWLPELYFQYQLPRALNSFPKHNQKVFGMTKACD